MKISFCVLLRVCIIHGTYSCGGGGGGEKDPTTTWDPDYPVPPADEDSGYWPVPTGSGLTVEDFQKKHEDERKIRQEEYAKWSKETSSAEKRKPKDEAQDWPAAHWTGVGPPYKGQALPKWASIKGRAGKPELCYEPPSRGNCTRYVYRFGYNPYTEKCERYVYGGCDGSDNNFYNMRRCNEVCISPKKACRRCKDPPKLPNFEEWEDLPHILEDVIT